MTIPTPDESGERVSDEKLQELRAACEMGPPVLKAPTIDELEKILQQADPPSINIQPDGSITAGPPEIRIPVADMLAIVRELQRRRSTDTRTEVLEIIRGFLECPEIADCAPDDKDPETDALERRARAALKANTPPPREGE